MHACGDSLTDRCAWCAVGPLCTSGSIGKAVQATQAAWCKCYTLQPNRGLCRCVRKHSRRPGHSVGAASCVGPVHIGYATACGEMDVMRDRWLVGRARILLLLGSSRTVMTHVSGDVRQRAAARRRGSARPRSHSESRMLFFK